MGTPSAATGTRRVFFIVKFLPPVVSGKNQHHHCTTSGATASPIRQPLISTWLGGACGRSPVAEQTTRACFARNEYESFHERKGSGLCFHAGRVRTAEPRRG